MTKLESGRSMVEMLGVLAIIGVLSIGGIMGYNMAMNRYKANDVLAAAAQVAVVADTINQGNGVTGDDAIDFTDVGHTANSVHGVSAQGTKASATANPQVKLNIPTASANIATIIADITGQTCAAGAFDSCTLEMANGSF